MTQDPQRQRHWFGDGHVSQVKTMGAQLGLLAETFPSSLERQPGPLGARLPLPGDSLPKNEAEAKTVRAKGTDHDPGQGWNSWTQRA